MFNFERDHSDIHSKLEDSIEYKYIREFYLRFNTRGIYKTQLRKKITYKSIEHELNSNASLRTLSCNTILNTNDDYLIKKSIDSIPSDLFKIFLKCSLYSMNDYAIDYLIDNWPFETLELYPYFDEAYSSLLLFYNTDINSFTGKIAPEILKWFLISSKYANVITNLFLKNQSKQNYKLKKLDLTGLPLSEKLLKKLIDKYYNVVFDLDDESKNSSDFDSIDFFSESSEDDLSNLSDSYSDESSNSSSIICSDSASSNNEDNQSILEFNTSSNSNINNNYNNKVVRGKNRSYSNRIKRICIDPNCELIRNNNRNVFKHKFQIKIDAILVNVNLLEKYLRIVKQIENMKSLNKNVKFEFNFEIFLNKLDLTIHNDTCCLIDDSFDSTALEINGLGIFFNASIDESKYVIKIIRKFKNINELNLSAFGRESVLSVLLDNDEIRDELSKSLGEFKNLKRLRLNTPNCKYRLEYLFKNLQKPLEYLNLTSCGLTSTDLNYLTNSIHVNSLHNLVLSNNDLAKESTSIIRLLNKCSDKLEVLDLGCNSFDFETYFKIVNESIVNMINLKMLITLDVFTFDNYLKLADRLNYLNKFVSWRINYSADYYEQTARIKNKFKFRKFKSDYIKILQSKFEQSVTSEYEDLTKLNERRITKITINDPDLSYILNELF